MDTLTILQGENARLQRENRELKDQLRRLYAALRAMEQLLDVWDDLTPDFDPLSLLADVLDAALEAVDSDNGSLLLADEEAKELVFALVRGPYAPSLTGFRIPMDTGIAGWVYQTGRPALVPDVRRDPRWTDAIDQVTHYRTRSVLAVPLVAGGRKLGVLEAVNPRSGEAFTENDQSILSLVARLGALVLDKADRLSEEGG